MVERIVAVISCLLAPCLINVKHLSFEEAFDIIDKWLCKCNDLEPLDFDTELR